MALTANIRAYIDWIMTKTASGASGTFSDELSKLMELVDGTAAGQVDVLYQEQDKALAFGATVDYDLSGSLLDPFGDAAVFARVKGIIIVNTSDLQAISTSSLIELGGGSNPFVNWIADGSDKLTIRAPGALILFASDATAYEVTAGTGDILRVKNIDGSSQSRHSIALVGASA